MEYYAAEAVVHYNRHYAGGAQRRMQHGNGAVRRGAGQGIDIKRVQKFAAGMGTGRGAAALVFACGVGNGGDEEAAVGALVLRVKPLAVGYYHRFVLLAHGGVDLRYLRRAAASARRSRSALRRISPYDRE